MNSLDGYFTPAQVAEMLGVSVASVLSWCRAKTMESVRIGHYYFIPKAAVEPFIDPPRPTNVYTKPYLSIAEAAAILNINQRTLQNWCAKGKVRTVKRGGRRLIARRTINRLRKQLVEKYQR